MKISVFKQYEFDSETLYYLSNHKVTMGQTSIQV